MPNDDNTRRKTMKNCIIAAFCALAMSFAAHAAQPYPVKPIRMLVGFPAGGAVDITARLVGQHLGAALGQQIVIDNRPGAGGTLAATLLLHAEPDGYTLSVGANGEMAISPTLRPHLPYAPLRDFLPISRIGSSELALVVYPGVPAKSVAELIALAKAQPGKINFASSGTGSTAHLAGELFKRMAGIDIVHVPYRGAAPALADLIAGQVQMFITGYSSTVPHLKAGRLRALGVTGAKRLAAAPDLPTIGETVKGYEVTSWYGVFAPKGTPRAIVDRLHRAIAAVVKEPPVVERLTALGIQAEGNTPDEFRAQIRDDIEKWAKVIREANVRLQ
jgi:tripartite-type tricarboxylate transporter receptor subunit TctC